MKRTVQSITEKRKKDAARQAKRRLRLKAEGVPQTHELERVILEAFSYAWHEQLTKVQGDAKRLPPALLALWADLGKFALKRLTLRHGYDRGQAKAAFYRALRSRPGNHINRQGQRTSSEVRLNL